MSVSCALTRQLFAVAAVCVIGSPQSDECDAMVCNDGGDEVRAKNLICAVSDHGAVATFRSECGVKVLNCYQRLYNGPQYWIVARKMCARRDVLFLRGRCDQLVCDTDPQPEKPACATNGDNISLFRSACHIEILNCYQRMYAKPSEYCVSRNKFL